MSEQAVKFRNQPGQYKFAYAEFSAGTALMKGVQIINMNKKLCAAVLTAAVAVPGAAPAFAADDITVKLDGLNINFDVAPVIENDRTLVPLRAIFEALGASVYWDGEEQTVISAKDNRTCTFQIGNANMFVTTATGAGSDTVIKSLDVPAKIKDDRTLIPLRAVSEAYECSVAWDEATRTVTITTPEQN